jgi:hypothetical protein
MRQAGKRQASEMRESEKIEEETERGKRCVALFVSLKCPLVFELKENNKFICTMLYKDR